MSNTTYCIGRGSVPRFCSSWNDGRPSSSTTTTSPSSTAWRAFTRRLMACSWGYSASTMRPARVCKETLPASMKLTSRIPSHLTSNSQRSSSKALSTIWAFIGSRVFGMGPFSALARLINPPWPSSRRLDQTASFPCSISSFVRPVLTEVSNFSMAKLGSAASSFFLISNQSLSDRVRTRA